MTARYEGEGLRRILCFGDSNTWGYEPATGRRYHRTLRWPGVLASTLGPGFEVLEEGLCGRTTVFEDPLASDRAGIRALPMLLQTHSPLDLVVILLGSNDFQARFAATAGDIAQGMGRLAQAVSSSGTGPGGGAPRVLLVAPPRLTRLTGYAETFEGGTPKSHRFAAELETVARQLGVGFLDAGRHATCSDRDGLHLEPDAHAALGRAVASTARELLKA